MPREKSGDLLPGPAETREKVRALRDYARTMQAMVEDEFGRTNSVQLVAGWVDWEQRQAAALWRLLPAIDLALSAAVFPDEEAPDAPATEEPSGSDSSA